MDMFYREYKLKKDTLKTKAGAVVKWDVWRDIYTSKLQVSGINQNEEKFTFDEIGLREWFEPTGDPEPYYEKFPEDLNNHFYFGELSHNKMCRFCSVAQEVIDSKEYELEVTKIFRRLYEDKISENQKTTKGSK